MVNIFFNFSFSNFGSFSHSENWGHFPETSAARNRSLKTGTVPRNRGCLNTTLALYLELSDEDQESVEKIQEKLKVAFTDDAFSAFGKLVQMKWTGEPVNVCANEIRRLARLAKFDKVGLEDLVKLTFVNGIPNNISVALQKVPEVLTIEISKLISHAMILSSKQQGKVVAVTARKGGEGGGGRPENRPQSIEFKVNVSDVVALI